MASNYTSNYNLCQWVKSDKVLMEEFNADNAKIDAALDGLEWSKASVSALNSLKTVVDGKADKSELSSLSTTVSGQGTALAKRNCAVHFQTYAGSGAANRTFTFSSKPYFLLFFRSDPIVTMAVRGQYYGVLLGTTQKASDLTFSWSGNSVTADNAATFLNGKNNTYTLLALLEL